MSLISAILRATAHGIFYAVGISTRANVEAMYCIKVTGYSIVFVRYTNVDGDGETKETPPDFHDFIPFWPFPGPTAKQFARGEIVCGLKVNRDILLGGSLHEPVAGQLGAEKLVVGKVINGAHHQADHS
ncbi:hypothetical protein Q1695_013233 [Nippostrongylus brasiliensis]|nr:hypothetical protein Q1695_013233 [Nippostrongylus brasiliensis]